MSKLLKRSFRRNCAFACQSKHGRQFYTICLHVEFSTAILPCDFNWSFQNYDSPQFYLNCKGINTVAFVQILICLWPDRKNRLIKSQDETANVNKTQFPKWKMWSFWFVAEKERIAFNYDHSFLALIIEVKVDTKKRFTSQGTNSWQSIGKGNFRPWIFWPSP